MWNKHVHTEMAWGALELVVWVLIQVGVGSWALPACRMTGCGIFGIGLPGRSSLQLKPHSLDRVIGGWCRISSMLHPTSQIPTSSLFMVNLQKFEPGLRIIAAGIPFQLVGFYCRPHKGQGDLHCSATACEEEPFVCLPTAGPWSIRDLSFIAIACGPHLLLEPSALMLAGVIGFRA